MATQLNIQALIFIGVLGLSFAARSQTATPNQIPELEQKLSAAVDAAEKAALCNELCFAYQRTDLAKAIVYGEQARTGAKAAGLAREEAKALNLLGDAAIRQRNMEQAAGFYQEALQLAKAAGDAEMEGRALHNKGKLAQTTGQIEEALVFYEQAFHIRERIGDQQGLSSTTQNLGVLYADRGDYEKSIFYYLKALQLKEATGDKAGTATVQANLANNYLHLSRFSDAELLLRASIATNKALDNKRGLAQGYMNLGPVLARLGQTEAAIEAFIQAKGLFEELGDKKNVAGVLNNLGQYYTDRAQYVKAQEALLEALKIMEGLQENGPLRYLIYQGLGRVKGYQGQFREELGYYAKAMPFAGNDLGRANLIQTMAAAYIGDLQFEKGLATAQEGIALARKNGFQDREADCLAHAASALLNLKRLDEALKTIDEAIALSKKINYQAVMSSALVVRSRILAQINQDKKKVLANAQEALEAARRLNNPLDQVSAWEELAEAYRNLGQADEALDALKKAQLLRDSIYSKDDIRTLAVQEKDYEFDKRARRAGTGTAAGRSCRRRSLAATAPAAKRLDHYLVLTAARRRWLFPVLAQPPTGNRSTPGSRNPAAHCPRPARRCGQHPQQHQHFVGSRRPNFAGRKSPTGYGKHGRCGMVCQSRQRLYGAGAPTHESIRRRTFRVSGHLPALSGRRSRQNPEPAHGKAQRFLPPLQRSHQQRSQVQRCIRGSSQPSK